MKNYYKPTPKKFRKLGDALLGVSLMAIPANLTGHTWIAVSMFAIGVLGKFLTNFFSDDEPNTEI